jgi:CheY-like chemotaxis protein
MSGLIARPVVLVVDQECLIRMGMVAALEDVGGEAIEAANGDEALAVIDQRRDIRVLFCDINRWGGGLALAQWAHEARPTIRLVLTSSGQAPHGRMPPGAEFVAKPYRTGDVAKWLLSA